MSRYIKNMLALIILAFFAWYLAKNYNDLKALLCLSAYQLVLLYALCAVQVFSSACVVKILLGAIKVKTSLWDMVLLQNASVLLNYLPMKFGTLFRANYLKHRYGLSYSHFATFFMYMTFLMTAAASIVGLTVLLLVYGLQEHENKILFFVFLVCIAISLMFLFIPLPVPKGNRRFVTLLRNFLISRKNVFENKKAITIALLFLVLNFVLSAFRLGIIYGTLDLDINPAGYLILGAIGYVVLFISITPGAIGLRELFIGSGAVVIGVSLKSGILGAVIDRAVILSFMLVIGGGCTLWLWHKYPCDFKKGKDIST